MVAATVTLSGKHDSLPEGARLGLVVGTTIWAWLAVVDAVAGEPFRTFAVLGGIALFTTTHYLLNLAYVCSSCPPSTALSGSRAWSWQWRSGSPLSNSGSH